MKQKAYVSAVTYAWLLLLRNVLSRNKQLINTVTKNV